MSTRHGVLDVLRPYLTAITPVTITPRAFEEVVKHHCVADLNVTVYDEVDVIDRRLGDDGGQAVLSDGTSRWELHADRFVDAEAPADARCRRRSSPAPRSSKG